MTSAEVWIRLKPVVEPALELPPEDRPAYVDEVCSADPELREEAWRVLDACERAHHSLGLLDSPAVELAAPLLELEAESLDSSGELTAGVAVGPYVLERHLGAGGMGVVYLARDPRLDRRVALKLLPAWLPVGDEANRRLTAEAKAASKLDHPNIQTVYEIGRTPDERPFIAMAYYEGETLKDRIARGGPLDVGSALEIARQMADGLGAAHRHGIVHRDVKPGNVIVTPEGLVKVLDFGAAKITGHALDHRSKAVGTVAYMSPEQTRGEDVDARTDVWSLGVVIFEMLTGRRPFTGDDVESMMRAVRDERLPPLEGLRPDAPEALVRVVERCLEKDREARFEDAASVAEEVRRAGQGVGVPPTPPRADGAWRWSGAAALIGAALVGAVILWPDATPAPGVAASATAVGTAVGDAHPLAVLPLAVSADRPEDEYLSEALTEALIADLHRVEGLDVATRGQVVPYRASPLSIDQIARILRVETVLSASVWEADEEVHLSVRLLDAASREALWSEDFVTPFAEVLTVERRIVAEVAEALGLSAPEPRGRLSAPSGVSPGQALRMYWKGQHFLHMIATSRASRRALEYFDEAIRLDSAYAPAWAGRSGALHQLVHDGELAPHDAEPEAIDAAERALALDEELVDAHTHLAGVLSWYVWDEVEARRHFERALELDSMNARAHRFFAVHLRNHHDFDRALEMIQRGAELDPRSPGAYLQEGLILYMAGQYDLALGKYNELLTIAPDYQTTWFYIALAHLELGNRDDALAALDSLERMQGTPMSNQGLRTRVLIQMGDRDVARNELARLESLEPSGGVLFNRAAVHSALGEPGRSLDLLEEAVDYRAWQLQMLAVAPGFESVRSSARYRPRLNALLERLGLPTG